MFFIVQPKYCCFLLFSQNIVVFYCSAKILFRQIRDANPTYAESEIQTLAAKMYEKLRYHRKCLRSGVVAESLGNSSAEKIDEFCTMKGWKDSMSLKRRNNSKVRAVSNVLKKRSQTVTLRDLEKSRKETTAETIRVFKMFKMLFFFIL